MLIDSEGYKAKQRKEGRKQENHTVVHARGGEVCQAMSATRVRTKDSKVVGEGRHGGKGSPGASGTSSRTSNI
jgi:hypothetical protein